jgi:phage/plasmid-like protein (TIGR03299 family)
MAHEIEYREDRHQWSFAFTGERSAIWHKLGQQAQADWTAAEWMANSGQDFEVEKVDLREVMDLSEGAWHANITHALRRKDNLAVLTLTSDEWAPAQNAHAWDFLQPLIDAGFCTPNTAGTLFDGRRCFVLAKTQEGFSLPGGDDTEGYILVQISHEYGIADLVLPTSVRVVCANTLRFALERASNKGQIDAGKFVHRAKTAFSVDKAKALIEAYKLGLGAYAEKAKFLSTKIATPEQTRAYINKVFKLEEMKDGTADQIARRQEHNKKVVAGLLEAIEAQPGASMSEGSWWSKFHGITFFEDHGRWNGREDGETFTSKFAGAGAERKQRALDVALEMATAG